MVILTASCDYYLGASVHHSIVCCHVHSCDNIYFLILSPQDGQTALMLASDSGHIVVVQLLLSNGAQVDMQDKVRHSVNL